jgi:hypothetical protein
MPAPPTYFSVLTDPQGVVKGELTGAKSTTLSLQHKGVPSLSLQVPLWHRHAAELLSDACLLKLYRREGTTTQLLFCGPVLSAEENGDALNQTVMATAVGPFWRLTKRYIGLLKGGIEFGTEATPRDLARIARDALITTNGAGYTGIEPPADVDDGGIANGSTGKLWIKNVAELIAELAASLNAFDFRVDPVEPTNVGKAFPQIGALYTAPMIGTEKPNAIFEYGTPRANVVSYKRAHSRDEQINQAIVGVQGWPDATTKDLVVRNGSTAGTEGLLQGIVPDGGIVDDAMRAQIGDEHLYYRETPKKLITFTPAINASPRPFIHYNVGDWVRARAIVRNSVRFDNMFRVWGLNVTLDDGGNESVELKLVDES